MCRQALWALLPGHVNFTLMYHTGSHNVKPDALSHSTNHHLNWNSGTGSTMQVMTHLTACLCQTPPQMLQWGHSSKLFCHPRANSTLHFIDQLLWWPSVFHDTLTFVSACFICACRKTTHKPQAGLLYPLPIPRCPWSLR